MACALMSATTALPCGPAFLVILANSGTLEGESRSPLQQPDDEDMSQDGTARRAMISGRIGVFSVKRAIPKMVIRDYFLNGFLAGLEGYPP